MRLLRPSLLLAGLFAVAQAPAQDKYVTIKGQITVAEVPKPVVLDVTGADKPVCCKDGDLISSKLLVDAKSKGVQNVVVFLRPDDDDRDAKFPADKIHKDLKSPKSKTLEVDQPKCQFEPRVIAGREGDKMLVKNGSSIPHNVKIEGCGLSLNVLIPAGGKHEVGETLKADRNGANFECNIHGWMAGKLFVFDHPYFAVTDKDGKFEIPNAPEGKFRIVYRHEMGFHKGKDGRLGFPIDIKDGGKGTMEVKAFDLELPKPDTK